MKHALVGFCFIVLAPPSNALKTPNHSPLDSNIQYANYQNNNVVAITAYVGMATQIVFDKNERIEQVKTGFSEGWEMDTQVNHLFIKAKSVKGTQSYVDKEGSDVIEEISISPNAREWKTNLLVVTNKRNYAFLLGLGVGSAGQRQNTYRLTFDYPEEEAKRKATQRKSQQLARKLRATVTPQNWDYVMQVGNDSRRIAPVRAFDDGRFTYITFAQNSEIPAIFIVTEGATETLINSHINPKRPNTVVIQQIAKQFVLRLDRAVVGISNQDFDIVSVETTTGTRIKGITREVRS